MPNSRSIRGRSLASIIRDKRKLVFNRLKKSSPTIIISREEGIYVFAPSIGKVHSTILMAGTGQNFKTIENWFRDQINELILGYAPNVPKARVEVNLLPRVFQANTEAVRGLVYADVVLLEVQDDPSDDDIIRIDFQGDLTRFSSEDPVVVSYKEPIYEESVGWSEEEESEEGDVDAVSHDLDSLGFSGGVDALREDDAVERLLEVYPGDKGFLDREKRQEQQWQWIFKRLD